jgi:hypothetical protein
MKGGKRKTKYGTYSKGFYLHIYLWDEELEALDSEAARRRVTRGRIIREAVRKAVGLEPLVSPLPPREE